MKNKIIKIGLVSTTLLTPIATIISCSKDDKDSKENTKKSKLSKLTDDQIQALGLNLFTFRKLGELAYDKNGNPITKGNNARLLEKIRKNKLQTLDSLPGEVNWWFLQMGNAISIALYGENRVDPADGDWSPSKNTFKSTMALKKHYFPNDIPKETKDFYKKIVDLAKDFKTKNSPYLRKLKDELKKLKNIPENALKFIMSIHNVAFSFRWPEPILKESKNVQLHGDTKFANIIRTAKYLGVEENKLNEFVKTRMSSPIKPTENSTNSNFVIKNEDPKNALNIAAGIYEGATDWETPIANAKIEIKLLNGKTKLEDATPGEAELKFTKGTLDAKTYVMWKKDNEYRFIDKEELTKKFSGKTIEQAITALNGNDNGLPALSLFTDVKKTYTTNTFQDLPSNTKIWSTIVKDNMIYKTDAITVAKAQTVTPIELYKSYTAEILENGSFKGSLVKLSDYFYDKFIENFLKDIK